MTDVRARFGAALREVRARQNLTQAQLAARSGLSQKFIGEIERGGANPSLATLDSLADGLRVDIADLFEPLRELRSTAAYGAIAKELQVIRDASAVIEANIGRRARSTPVYAPIKRRRKRSS